MGGIGKTSLAKHVFQLHSSKFYKSSFIEGVDRRCNEQFTGLIDLQKQLHGDISKKIPLAIHDVSIYTTKIEKALTREKVFIVLDDIGSLDQLDALLRNKGLHPGSKIIITTKDASLTKRRREVLLNGLDEHASLELLCIHAFTSHTPKDGYEEVSEKLVKYCEGHPLALEVLGKLLHKRDVAYWEECLKGLKKEPHSDRDLTETILNACDMETRYRITNLFDKCLLSTDGNIKYLMMHSLIQDMGRNLVRQEYLTKPWKRSRLWCHEESFRVLKQEKDTENILGLELKPRLREIFKRGNSMIEQARAEEKKSSSKSNKEGVRRSDQTTATAPSEEGPLT
ncbi:disease resistance protein RUN1-like [Bidens hawaiensis]|uniref:disease resistance protein RUN1-like n=1 Tax=Bidens hawaiensis TaxID=980011 RepID=UPI00404B57FF